MNIAILCVAILALLQTALGISISACRWKYKRSTGVPDDPAHVMKRIVTAYENCAEWHPVFFALLLILPMTGAPKWSIWLGPVVVTARCLLVAGLVTFTLKKSNIFRFAGAALTYLTLLMLCVLIIGAYLTGTPTPNF